MYDFDRIITDCRNVDLDQPDVSAPNDDAIFGKAADIAQLRHNQAQNAAPGWSVRYYDLTVQPGKTEYLIPLGESFGKPSRIHTIDPTDRYHCTRKIPIVDIQNVDEYYNGPQQSRTGGANRHSAVAFVLYWRFGQPYLKPVPEPNDISKYRIWYETGAIPEPILGDNLPVPESFHRYLRISISIAILPQCRWTRLFGDDPKAISIADAMTITKTYQNTLLDGLLKQEAEYRKEYDDYIATSQQSGVNEPNGYADWYEG